MKPKTPYRREVRETNEEKMKAILESMQGITLHEWNKLKQVVDTQFKSEAAIQIAKIHMASPKELMDSYKRLF